MAISEEQEEKLRVVLETLVENRKFLSPWEQSFLDDQVKRHDEHGAGIHMSPKQFAVLDKMMAKVSID